MNAVQSRKYALISFSAIVHVFTRILCIFPSIFLPNFFCWLTYHSNCSEFMLVQEIYQRSVTFCSVISHFWHDNLWFSVDSKLQLTVVIINGVVPCFKKSVNRTLGGPGNYDLFIDNSMGHSTRLINKYWLSISAVIK